MTKPGSRRALALSRRDQVMEEFKKDVDQLESIYEDGPQNDDDLKSIKACIAFVIGEVYFAQAEEFEEEEKEKEKEERKRRKRK